MNFDEMTKEELIDYIRNLDNETAGGKYGLVWDKEKEPEQIVVECDKYIPILKEVKDKNVNNGGEENILIEGDNFHALSVLNYTHKEKIDIIYIDPPYNRGKNDFIYNDKFVDKEDGYRHSKWLNFMQKRLLLARNLLKEDGLIFISIDDYEFAQLKMLCDKIFGETQFINMFIWQRNSSGKTEKDKFTVNTEYVLLYAKTLQYKLTDTYKPLSDSTIKMYTKDDNDGRGKYRLYPLQKPSNPGPETTYDYIDNNGKVWPCPPKGWRMKYSKLKALENDGRLCLENKSLSEKAYWNERDSEGKRIDTLWNDIAENSVGSKELDNLIGKPGTFDNPKPTELIKRCLKISKKDAIVLDFFAGSGTTGQSVLELNQEDGGTRQFILCTSNENNICENVTYQRCKISMTGQREDQTKYSDGINASMKYFRTDFVENTNNRDQLYYDLTEKCIPMLCVKENCFENVKSTKEYMIFSNKQKNKYTCVYFDLFGNQENDFINDLKAINEKKVIYKFSLGDHIDESIFADVENYTIEAIPYKIVEVYRKLVKLSKEDN